MVEPCRHFHRPSLNSVWPVTQLEQEGFQACQLLQKGALNSSSHSDISSVESDWQARKIPKWKIWVALCYISLALVSASYEPSWVLRTSLTFYRQFGVCLKTELPKGTISGSLAWLRGAILSAQRQCGCRFSFQSSGSHAGAPRRTPGLPFLVFSAS